MLFSSTIFIFFFLPLVLILFYLAPSKFKNFVLLLASLIFYAWGGVSYSVILVLSIIINYFIGLKVASSDKKKSKIYLIVGVIANLILLVIFKYANFLIDNLNILFTGINVKTIDNPNIKLPIGISFFTFQALSYLTDVYRGTAKVQKSFVNIALYISLFPQLIAGPIIRYYDISKQLNKRIFSINKFGSGVERFIIGLSKKVLLANNMAIIADNIFSKPAELLSSSTAWVGVIAYSFQIYFDFSGYSDMAIGLGRMFGFNFLENFNFPYISKSIKEFWRRWHISLSSWFRDYLYIPLGGNRLGQRRTYINLFIVFILTGLWHGASWSFMLWGVIHGVFIVVEKIGFDKALNRLWLPLQHIYTLTIVMFAWVFFRLEKIGEAFNYCKAMIGIQNTANPTQVWTYLDKFNIIIFLIAIISSSGFITWIYTEYKQRITGRNHFVIKAQTTLSLISLLILFTLSFTSLLSGTYNPFIYFRF